jgi:hypothetical protein
VSLGAQIGVSIVVFVAVTAIAELAGAANLGVAAGIGQIAFAVALLGLILRSP